ncbi:MAG: Qat anti-phage system QueC-like protein QatC [Mycobacterium sp.]
MSSYRMRIALDEDDTESPEVQLLDWRPGSSVSTVQVGKAGARFFEGWRPPREALDLALLGAAAYCADKVSLRRLTADRWTRELDLELPVQDAGRWADADWSSVLSFLTGDRWAVTARTDDHDPLVAVPKVPAAVTAVGEADAVCLFSGGLDSLCGVVDLLEGDPALRLCLLSHHEGGQASTAQEALLAELFEHYGPDRLVSKRLFLRPAPPNAAQARPLPARRENTTRARSLLFLTTAVALAASVGPTTPVFIPENGFIGINVPLTRARSGSYSTRTTHPHFIKTFTEAAARCGVNNPVLNPYRLTPKGQMLAYTLNPDLLRRLAPLSVSCSHPEAARYVQRDQGNCGYCFPCLIRRASMAHVGWDSADGYAWDALDGSDLLSRATRRASDLRAVVNGVFADRPDRDVLRNGPIPDGEQRAFLRVWRAGLEELRSWLQGATGATAELIRGLQ